MTAARFEYRVFRSVLKAEQRQLASLSDPSPSSLRRRISHEYYIIPQNENRYNVKIRDGKIDIKFLSKTVDGCEQWQPRFKSEFPLSAKYLKDEILPALDLETPDLNDNSISLQQFIEILRSHPGVRTVKVKKIRRSYRIQTAICEFASITIEDKKIETISVEAEDVQKVRQVIKEIGIDKYENTNYIRAIRKMADS
jgi:hypothetical protein